MELSNSTPSCVELMSTFHLFCMTSVMRPTTISPISPVYRARTVRTKISLLTRSTTPTTVEEGELFMSVPWPLNKKKGRKVYVVGDGSGGAFFFGVNEPVYLMY